MKISHSSFLFLFICFTLVTKMESQLNYFGTNAKNKPMPKYIFTPYMYYDFIRTTGLGLHYQVNPILSVDFSTFLVIPNERMKNMQEDFWDYQGYGFALNPKFHLPYTGKVYFGLYSSLQKIQHDIITVTQSYYYPSFKTNTFSCKGIALSYNLVFGIKLPVKRTSLEFYLMLGSLKFLNSELTYYGPSTTPYPPIPSYPYTTTNDKPYIDIRLGVKLGLGLQKNKKNLQVDKKFDEEYLSRYTELASYLQPFDVFTSSDYKLEKRTKRKLKMVNQFTVMFYRWHYHNTKRFYEKLDAYFSDLETRVEKLKSLPKKQPK